MTKTGQEAAGDKHSPIDGLESWKIGIPIAIGLGATAWMFSREYEPGAFNAFNLSIASAAWIAMAFVFMAMRDVGYMIRIRVLSDNELHWHSAFRIIMLWEFASAVTPSAVGGTSVALFFVNREGISAGRSTGIVMMTSFLDELYFAIMFPLLIIAIGHSNIFGLSDGVANALTVTAWVGYGIKMAYIAVLGYGMFVNPRGLKWLLLMMFKLPILRRWRTKMGKIGDDIVETARHFRTWPKSKWLKAFGATWLSWTSRYWVANALIIAFFGIGHLGLFEHLIVFGKQLAMWIMMLVSPTPGGSGFAEYIFKEFLSDYIPTGAVALALCWRMVSYYPYLIMGAILLPRWVKRIINKKEAAR